MLFVSNLSLLLASAAAAAAAKDRTVLRLGSDVPTSREASFTCETINLWTTERHPDDFPNNAHWSPPVYAAHDGNYTMFKEGGMATAGVELVAETGDWSEIRKELAATEEAVKEYSIGGGFGGSLGDKSRSVELKFDECHQLLSFVSMIAPSPDWISGTYDYPMADDGNWLAELIVDTFPWDAGTDAGDTYTSPNADNDEPIFQITKETVNGAGSCAFLSDNKRTVLPVARLHCILDGNPPSCDREIDDACASNADCCPASGLTCQDAACRPSLARTQPCAGSHECASGRCRGTFGRNKLNKNRICK